MSTVTNIGSLIERRSGFRGGRPMVAGTSVSVQRIAGWYKLGLSPEEIAENFGHLSLAQVHEEPRGHQTSIGRAQPRDSRLPDLTQFPARAAGLD